MKKLESTSAKGLIRYNVTSIEAVDRGDFALIIAAYTAYNEKGTLRDTGT